MRKSLKPIGNVGFTGGYKSNSKNRQPNELAPPSFNVRLTRGFSAITRKGYSDTTWDLGEAGKTAYPFHVKRFNVTLFALGTKVKYVDHNDGNRVVDTGITLTDGTTTRMLEYAGQVLLSNTTDGQRLIVFTKLNDAAATAGDANVTVDIDGGVRMDRFDTALSPGTKNLRIRGTDEQYASIAAGTGVVTLSGTLSQSYPDNVIAIVVYDISSGRPKASKLVEWRESINAINVSEQDASSTSDVPPSTVHFTSFATAATIENCVGWTGGTSGRELVGKAGILKNAIATHNNLYLFKEDKTLRIAIASLDASSGARPPQPFLENEGCANEDSAANMGSDIIFATRSGRILRIRYSNEYGSDSEQLDNGFDEDVLEHLNDLQPDFYEDCIMHYDPHERLVYFQGRFENGEVLTLIYENRPVFDDEGRIVSEGRWLPPDKNKSFGMYFNIGERLYATDRNDDTVYLVNDGRQDQQADIECTIAPGVMEVREGRVTCMWKEIEVIGGLTQNATMEFTPYLYGEDGAAAGNPKEVTGAQEEDLGLGIGGEEVGEEAIGEGEDEAEDFAEFAKRWFIYPSLGYGMQPVFSTLGNGEAMRIDSYKITATAYPISTLTAQ